MVLPCCFGISLQRGSTIVAIIEIVISVFFLCVNLILLASFLPEALEEQHAVSQNPEADKKRIQSMLTVLVLLNTSYWVGSLLLGIWLYIGAKQRDLRKCRAFFIVTCILTVLYIVEVFMEAFSMRSNAAQIVSPVIGTLLQGYMLWVVSSFMDEMRLGGCTAIKSGENIEA